MKKLSICFVAPLPPPYGGIANWTFQLKKHLELREAERISFQIVDSSPKRRATEGRGLFERIFGGSLGMISVLYKLKKECKKTDCRVIHITTSGSLGMIRDNMMVRYAKKKKIKSVYHIHFGRVAELFALKNKEYKLLKYGLNHCSEIIVIDKKTRDVLRENGYGEKTHYIPNGIDVTSLPKCRKEREKILTFVGWVIPKKGIGELVSAWNLLSKEEKKGWKLRLIGPYKKEYIESLDMREDIEMLGEVEHGRALELLNEGRGFVLPSYSEGFPYSVLEAMALGLNIIVTEVGDMKEMLLGTSGRTVKPKDIEGLKRAIIEMIEEEEGELHISVMEKVEKEYEMTKIVRKYLKVWEKE